MELAWDMCGNKKVDYINAHGTSTPAGDITELNAIKNVFDNEVPRQWRMDLFSLIAKTPNLDWLILTKRIGNVKRMSSWDSVMFDMIAERCWLGITVVNQEEANRDIPKLLEIPAKVHWLSMEPLLGPVDLTDIHWPDEHGVQVFSALECDVPPEDDPFDGDLSLIHI